MKIKISLKSRILVLSLSLVLVLGICASVLVNTMMDKQRALTLKALMTFSHSLSDAISSQFYERYGDVQAFAINPVLLSSDKLEIEKILNQYVKLYSIYDLILFVDLNGKLVASNNQDATGANINSQILSQVNFSEESWFQSLAKGEFTNDLNKGFQGTLFEGPFSDPHVDQIYGQKSWMTSFSTVVRNKENQVIGYLSNRTNMKWVESEVANIYKALKSVDSANSELAIIDKQGQFIVEHTPDEGSDLSTVQRDWEVVGKKNLAQEHPDLWDQITAENSKNGGFKLTYDSDLDISQGAAYTTLNNSKFIESIGWRAVVMQEEKEMFAPIIKLENTFYIVFISVVFFSVLISKFFSTKFGKDLTQTASTILDSANKIQNSSQDLSLVAQSLQKVSSNQSSAVHETSSTLDQFSSMVSQTSDNVIQAQNNVKNAVDQTELGKGQMENMVSSILQIEKNAKTFADVSEVSNKEVGEIIVLITEISDKTKLINEIVFQTKLLSFNASVEAARAGEAGKGFAVVAEEVGNLAKLSGDSAQQISTLLDSSTQKVKAIVENNKLRQQEVVKTSLDTVRSSLEIARECQKSFDSILSSIYQSNQKTSDIATAALQQNSGVKEINKAIQLISEMTQVTNLDSEKCSATALSLEEKSQDMVYRLEGFVEYVNGQKIS